MSSCGDQNTKYAIERTTRRMRTTSEPARPFLSIIIPCRDRQVLLAALLAQLRLQIGRREDIEVIIVDDGSSPPLRIEKAPWIRLIRHGRSLGAPAARQTGFDHASGSYLHFHDSDDLFGHEWIARTFITIGSEPQPDVIVTSRVVVTPDGTASFWPVSRLSAVARSLDRLRRYQRFINCMGPLGGVTFSRRAAEAITFHRTSASQDWLMYDDALASAGAISCDNTNYFIFNKTQKIRISNNARARARGYVFAARTRFQSRRMRRLVARIYCAHAANELDPVIKVRHRWLKRFACELLARYPILAGT